MTRELPEKHPRSLGSESRLVVRQWPGHAAVRGLSRDAEEAGSDLYGKPSVVYLRVTLPAIWPAILAGALLSFTLSFDNFVTTFFTAGSEVKTLPLQIWAMVPTAITPRSMPCRR